MSEYTYEIDLLDNHDSASRDGQATVGVSVAWSGSCSLARWCVCSLASTVRNLSVHHVGVGVTVGISVAEAVGQSTTTPACLRLHFICDDQLNPGRLPHEHQRQRLLPARQGARHPVLCAARCSPTKPCGPCGGGASRGVGASQGAGAECSASLSCRARTGLCPVRELQRPRGAPRPLSCPRLQAAPWTQQRRWLNVIGGAGSATQPPKRPGVHLRRVCRPHDWAAGLPSCPPWCSMIGSC